MRRVSPALALFLAFQALYGLVSSGWVFRVADELEVYFQTESLGDRGSLAIPQAIAVPDGGRSIFFGKKGGPEREPYAPYGPLVAFLALPFHGAARVVAAASGVDRGATPEAWRILVSGLTALAAATAGALAVAGFFRAARALGASERRAFGLSCVLGAATVILPYSKSFFSEAFAAAAFAWAAALLLEAREKPSPARLGAAALLIMVAGLVKATNLVYAPAFVLAPLAEKRFHADTRARAAAVLTLAVVLSALVHAQWNAYRFGDFRDFGYDWSETISGAVPRPFGGSLVRGVIVLLLSPGKSLLVWAPALVLAIARARELGRDPALALSLLSVLGLGVLFFGSYFFPEGGYCHGPRHLVPIVPLLLLPAVLGAPPNRALVALVLVLGLPMNLLAASVSYLEDQAIGEDRSRQEYYEKVDPPEPGLPANRYRLGYVPQLSLTRIAARSIARIARGERETPGTGIDVFALHLARARNLGPPFTAIPAWIGPSLAFLWLVLLGFSAMNTRSALLRGENSAILIPGSSP